MRLVLITLAILSVCTCTGMTGSTDAAESTVKTYIFGGTGTPYSEPGKVLELPFDAEEVNFAVQVQIWSENSQSWISTMGAGTEIKGNAVWVPELWDTSSVEKWKAIIIAHQPAE